MIQTRANIKYWLDSFKVEKYTINEDLTVDVDGDLRLINKGLTEIPIQFGYVSGTVYCGNNNLTSFKGLPHRVRGNFNCANNQITNFDYAPQVIGGEFICAFNPIESIKGLKTEIGRNFFHACSKDEPYILELKHLYKENSNNTESYVTISQENLLKIISYIELQEILPLDNTASLKKVKL
jgi:hypothetical protein